MSLDLGRPRSLHPFTLLLGPIRTLRGWIVPILIALAIRPGGFSFAGFFPLIVIVVVATAVQAIQVLRVRWWVSDGAFQMRVGVLQLESRSVPVERIQNVDVHEPLLPRLLGMAEVKIETAGSSGGNLALRYVQLSEASALREALVDRVEPGAGAVGPAVAGTLVETSTTELLIAGATANRVGTIVLILAAVWGWVMEAGIDPDDAISTVGEAVGGVDPVLAVSVAVVAAVLVGWLASIAATILRYHGFVLQQQGADLRRSHGLFSRSSGIIPLARVQAVRIERPVLRRMVHRASIVADTAGSLAAATDTGTGVVSPIIRDDEVPALVERVVGLPDPLGRELRPVSRLAIRRAFIRVAIPVALAGAIAVWLVSLGWAVAALALLGVAYLWAVARFRALGYRIDDDLVVARSGVLTRRHWLVPTSKVQSAVVRSSPFQRRLGLASLSIDTAGPGTRKVTIIDVDAAMADDLAERLSGISSNSGLVSDGV